MFLFLNASLLFPNNEVKRNVNVISLRAVTFCAATFQRFRICVERLLALLSLHLFCAYKES